MLIAEKPINLHDFCEVPQIPSKKKARNQGVKLCGKQFRHHIRYNIHNFKNIQKSNKNKKTIIKNGKH